VSSLDYRALSKIDAESALTFQPLLFEKIWTNLDVSNPVRILDFGAVQPVSMDFYSNSEVPCFITITDCLETLIGLQKNDEDETVKLKNIIDELFPDDVEPYDVILLWECFNYLDPAVFPLLNQKIKQLSHKKSLLYGYLHTSKYTTNYTCEFKINSESSFSCSEKLDKSIKPEVINALKLKKYMPDFEISRSVLIRNGLQEFIMQLTK